MEFDDNFDATTEFESYESAQPTDTVEGGVWCIRSQREMARFKKAFDDVVRVPAQAALEDFFALLNNLRDLYCIDEDEMQDASLESNDLFWVKAAISYMEALLHARESIAEIQPGLISTRLPF